MVKKLLKKIIGSGFGSSPKLNQFFLVILPKCPPSFVRNRSQLFEISCTQTDRQTERRENITSFTFGGGGNKTRKQTNGVKTVLPSFAPGDDIIMHRLDMELGRSGVQ